MTDLTTRVQNVAEILDIIQMLEGKTTGYFRAFKTNFSRLTRCTCVISEQHSDEQEHFRDVHTVQSRCKECNMKINH